MILLALACSGEPEAPLPPPTAPRDALGRVLHGAMHPSDMDAIQAFIAERRAREHGPWGQDISLATSTDGLVWHAVDGGPVVETAAVPELVRGDDGRLYLFHVDGDLDKLADWARNEPRRFYGRGMPGLGALGLSVSDDEGRTFSPVHEFEVIGLVLGMVVDPEVIRLPDGRWRLYYVGLPIQEHSAEAWAPGTKHKVWYAESSDLIRWQQVGLAVDGPYADPAVACFEERCVMLSFGLDQSTSTDGGRSFRYEGSIAAPGFAPDIQQLEDGRWRAWWNTQKRGAALQTATTPDLARWTTGVASLDTYGEAPSVLREGDQWLMAFHHFKPGVTPPDGATKD